MRGRYKIEIGTNRVGYKLCINRNLTIINGDSATGKSVLYELVEAIANKRQGVSVKVTPLDIRNTPSLNVVSDNNWKLIIQNTKDTIFFIDEFAAFVFSNEFSAILENNDNYFVIITRHYNKLKGLPISVNEVYDIVTSGKYHRLRAKYTNQYTKGKDLKVSDLPTYITEDTGSGRSFFKYATGGSKVIGAEGNGDVMNVVLKELQSSDSLVIIVDASAFGVYIEDLLNVLAYTKCNIKFLLPESFEYLLLLSPMFSSCNTMTNNPNGLIDSKQYKSWERFYTDVLIKCAKELGFSYSKKRGLPNRLKTNSVKVTVLTTLNLL